MSVAFNKYNTFVQDVGRKVHNLNSDTLKIALTNTAPNASTHAVLADITEITAQNGYSAGGTACTGVSYSQSSGTATLSATGPTFTGTGTFGPFRYAVLYNSTAASGPLIGWWDYGSSISVNNGDTFAVTIGTALTLA